MHRPLKGPGRRWWADWPSLLFDCTTAFQRQENREGRMMFDLPSIDDLMYNGCNGENIIEDQSEACTGERNSQP